MDGFIDRFEELAVLEEQYFLDEAALVVLYGRRRVGKTALIAEFLKRHGGVYFLATEESEEQNRRLFQQQVAAFTEDDLLGHAVIDSWDTLFDRLSRGSERIVIALDEFQNLGKANSAFPSVFQRIWDTFLSERNVMVILCGSLISLMESQVLSYNSPLYGRRTAQIRLKQVPFDFYGEFKPRAKNPRELIELYSVTGGVPKYIESFKDQAGIFSGIRKNVLDSSSYLYDEPNFLLSKEVSEVGSYFSILKAIAAGNRKSGEIAAALNVKQTSLTKYLKVLERLDILERLVPVTERNPEKSKRGLYRIKDNFIRFWFRFVFPNMGLLETGHADQVLKMIERNFIDGQVAYVYEESCRQRTWTLAAEGELPFIPSAVGAWWGAKDVEIDVVAIDDDGRALFGECKFWQRPVGVNVLEHLEEQAERASEDAAFAPYRNERFFAIFSISGFTDALKARAQERSDLFLLD